MTNDEARQYFKDRGLNYSKITPFHIRKLINMTENELIDYFENGGTTSKQMDMKLSGILKRDMSFDETGLKSAFLRVDGSYFKGREAISFNNGGFIGFAGWADSTNTAPIIKAFCKWCDWLKEKFKEE